MSQPIPERTMLPAEQHVIAAETLLLRAAHDRQAAAQAHAEAVLAGATAMLQLTETLIALGSLLAAHPVLSHALTSRQLIAELEEQLAASKRSPGADANRPRQQ